MLLEEQGWGWFLLELPLLRHGPLCPLSSTFHHEVVFWGYFPPVPGPTRAGRRFP